MRRAGITACAAAVLAVGGVGAGPARAIVNGQQVPIQQAPWVVTLGWTDAGTGASGTCSGSILDATHILTAAHCVVTTFGRPYAVTIHAGASNYGNTAEGEFVPAAGVGVHPYGNNGLGADDVAVVTLQRALNLSSPNERPVALAPEGANPRLGARVLAIGFGKQSPTAPPNGLMYSLSHELLDQLLVGKSHCSNEDLDAAVVLCAKSSSGAVCFGDSGGPLMVGSPPVQVGVLSRGTAIPGLHAPEDQNCQPRKSSTFVNVAQPEIREFIKGNAQPPRAPRMDGLATSDLHYSARRPSLVCKSDPWENAPTLRYRWILTRTGRTIGRGRRYRIRRRDRGHKIECDVIATNAGGSLTYHTVPWRITEDLLPKHR
jgi:hypothetical protein